ncbi:hypothetical protein MHYP_G00299280 [Metynnis hypsauchen]
MWRHAPIVPPIAARLQARTAWLLLQLEDWGDVNHTLISSKAFWDLMVQQKGPGLFQVRVVRGAGTELKFLTKRRKKLVNPRKRWTNQREIGWGQSTMALISAG